MSHDREYEHRIALRAPAQCQARHYRLAQIHGYRGETDTEDKMRKRVEYDLFYIDNWSLGSTGNHGAHGAVASAYRNARWRDLIR